MVKKSWLQSRKREQRKPDELRASTRIKDWWDRMKKAAVQPELEGSLTDGDIDQGLWKLHVNMGHASKGDMLKMMNIGNGCERAKQRCRHFECDECARHKAPRVQRSSKVRSTKAFRDRLGLDLIEVELTCGAKIGCLNIVDHHTRFQIVWPLPVPMCEISSGDVMVAFEQAWGHW